MPMIHATRKVHKTANGSRILTLTEYLGEDWEYVEIFGEKTGDSGVTLRIVVLTKNEIPDSPPTKVRKVSQSA
jgi:hypothetical protein